MVSTMAAVGNDIPHASRSTAAAFFARMEVVMQRQGRGCGNKSNNNGGNNVGRDFVMLAVTRADIGWCNESRQEEEEDAVMTAAAMSLHRGWAVDSATRGGGRQCKALLSVPRQQQQWVGSSPTPCHRCKGGHFSDVAILSDR
jgi:hypothetical protein